MVATLVKKQLQSFEMFKKKLLGNLRSGLHSPSIFMSLTYLFDSLPPE